MDITLQDLQDALAGQRRAAEVIFWFGCFWHNGRDDLYRAAVGTGFEPDQHRAVDPNADPELKYGLIRLQNLCAAGNRPLVERPLQHLWFNDVVEGDVLWTERNRWACIRMGAPWPCRVHRWHGGLGVACAEDKTGRQFHPLTPNVAGLVDGFLI